MKKILIVANWKLNQNKKKIQKFLYNLNQFLLNRQFKKNINISIAPPLLYLETSNNIIKKFCNNISLTAQNVDVNIEGSFTGETSIAMLKDMEYVRYVIVGHSERRLLHQEKNKIVSKKFEIIKNFKYYPILCIGETNEEKSLNKTTDVCQNQIDIIFKNLGNEAFKNSIIAYEPIWAIGSGISASVEYIQYMHQFIRNYIKNYNKHISQNLIILYGGSVNQNNAKNIFSQKDVNGALIGNASLNVSHFIKILKSAEECIL